MKMIIFGATGMVGHGALLESLDSPLVDSVVTVGRKEADISHPKLEQVVHRDFENFESLASAFAEFDACLWCLGVSSTGMSEEAYTRITYDYTMAAARVMCEQNPDMRFCFVSGAGTDSTEQKGAMWARVKGKVENALIKLPFQEVIIFRPGFIKPERGSKPRGTLYRLLYAVFGLFSPLIRFFGGATSSTEIGKAMVLAANGQASKQILESPDINALAAKTAVIV